MRTTQLARNRDPADGAKYLPAQLFEIFWHEFRCKRPVRGHGSRLGYVCAKPAIETTATVLTRAARLRFRGCSDVPARVYSIPVALGRGRNALRSEQFFQPHVTDTYVGRQFAHRRGPGKRDDMFGEGKVGVVTVHEESLGGQPADAERPFTLYPFSVLGAVATGIDFAIGSTVEGKAHRRAWIMFDASGRNPHFLALRLFQT